MQSVYGLTKLAMEFWAKVWAKELGGDGTTVNCVAPGPVDTDMWNAVSEEFRNSVGIEK